jgi:hypothetical protein
VANGEISSSKQNPSMKPVTRRKFIGVGALSGPGVASLSAHLQLAWAAEIDGVMEKHEMLNENLCHDSRRRSRVTRIVMISETEKENSHEPQTIYDFSEHPTQAWSRC